MSIVTHEVSCLRGSLQLWDVQAEAEFNSYRMVWKRGLDGTVQDPFQL